MSPMLDTPERAALCAQIDALRTRLENAVLSGSSQEALFLSRRLDVLINRLLLGPRHTLRAYHCLSAVYAHPYPSRVRPRRARARPVLSRVRPHSPRIRRHSAVWVHGRRPAPHSGTPV